MNSHEERDKQSEELRDSDLDNVAGGTGAGENPPPIDDEKDPGSIESPTDPADDPTAPPPEG